MILRWLALGFIAWLLVVAIFISLRAKPLNATAIVCNPTIPIDLAKQRFKGIQKA